MTLRRGAREAQPPSERLFRACEIQPMLGQGNYLIIKRRRDRAWS